MLARLGPLKLDVRSRGEDTMNAVHVPKLSAVLFFDFRLPREYEDFHGEMQEGVRFLDEDVQSVTHDWPRGSSLPDPAVCRSRSDPKLYRFFKRREDVDTSQFEILGQNYSCVPNRREFIEIMNAIARMENAGKWIAWSNDGRHLVASAETFDEIHAHIDRLGVERAVYEWVDPVPTCPTGQRS